MKDDEPIVATQAADDAETKSVAKPSRASGYSPSTEASKFGGFGFEAARQGPITTTEDEAIDATQDDSGDEEYVRGRLNAMEDEIRALRKMLTLLPDPEEYTNVPDRFVFIADNFELDKFKERDVVGNAIVAKLSGRESTFIDLGEKDVALIQCNDPTGQDRYVAIGSGGLQKVRYVNTPERKAFEQTYKRNPGPGDWLPIVDLTSCQPDQLSINLFNPNDVGGRENFFSGGTFLMTLGAPKTTPSTLTAKDQTDDGTTAAVKIYEMGASGGTLFRIRFIATGPTPKTIIRLFIKVGGGLEWFDEIPVPETNPVSIDQRWKHTWLADDRVNGLMAGANVEFHATVYDDVDSIKVLASGVDI